MIGRAVLLERKAADESAPGPIAHGAQVASDRARVIPPQQSEGWPRGDTLETASLATITDGFLVELVDHTFTSSDPSAGCATLTCSAVLLI